MKLYMNISFFYEGGLFGVDSILRVRKKTILDKAP